MREWVLIKRRILEKNEVGEPVLQRTSEAVCQYSEFESREHPSE